jgi:hypothetical protein
VTKDCSGGAASSSSLVQGDILFRVKWRHRCVCVCVLGTPLVQNGVHTVGVQGVTRWYKLTVFEGLVRNAISTALRVYIVFQAQ